MSTDYTFINLEEKFDQITEYWSPKIIGRMNGQLVKIAKFKGSFIRHKHDNEDELFQVFKGSIVMKFDDHDRQINQGEIIIVPKGIYHQPIAEEEAFIIRYLTNQNQH